MQYKVRYRPLEKLGRDGWERFDPARQDALIARAAASPPRVAGERRAAARGGSASGKDGVVGNGCGRPRAVD